MLKIVSQISEYANTQNKVSVSDLSSNRPFHIEIEKWSRNIFAPHVLGQTTQQTKWFYERARGQYKNARIKEGLTKAKQKAFDLRNPPNQMFNKEDLAKYVNAFQEIYDGKKLVIGPHWVVKGNQKNYAQFVGFNLEKKVDSIYYEDIVAKAILFRSAERIYGVKPNAIGDMRYITVPYAIAYLGYYTDYKLDLYKIWKNQSISDALKALLYELMKEIEAFIKNKAPGALYGEWAKKEECWTEVKNQQFKVDLNKVKADMIDPKTKVQRKGLSDEETSQVQISEQIETIKSVPPMIWHKIEDWGGVTKMLSEQQKIVAYKLAGRVRTGSAISGYERMTGLNILDIVYKNYPELLQEIDTINEHTEQVTAEIPVITIELVQKMIEWDKKNKKLKDSFFTAMKNIAEGKVPLSSQAIRNVKLNYETLKKYGFKA